MTPEEIMAALARPFAPDEVKAKPAVVKDNRALAMFYVDARVIQDRLDETLGVAGWQDDYECLPEGGVVCRLRLKIGDEWITKVDVGSPSEQPDEGDRRKAAFSDALKRAAVKFGVARYIYRVESQWVDYDMQKKKFTRPPTIPGAPRPAAKAANGPPPAAPAKAPSKRQAPKTGAELLARLKAREAELVAKKYIDPGKLIAAVLRAGKLAGLPADVTLWDAQGVEVATAAVKSVEAALKDGEGGDADE